MKENNFTEHMGLAPLIVAMEVLVYNGLVFSAKPLTEPMLAYCQYDPQEQTFFIKEIESDNFVCSGPFY